MSDLNERRQRYEDWVNGLHDDEDAIGECVDALEVEVKRLTNKLNEDSQNFQIECQKAEIELLRTKLPDPLAAHYRGNASTAFWNAIAELPNPAYELACVLQNVERDLLERIYRLRVTMGDRWFTTTFKFRIPAESKEDAETKFENLESHITDKYLSEDDPWNFWWGPVEEDET